MRGKMQPMFDLGQLRCFVAVAEELHFGHAAARLNMTQPPLSRQIKVLEHVIDAQLLERSSRSVKLTLAGRGFLPEAKRILRLAEYAALDARRVSSGKAGSIRIGFTASTAYSFLPALISACRVQLADIDISLKEMVSGDQFDALASRQIDAGLLRPPVARPGIQSVRIVSEPLLLALPEGHPLGRFETISIKDLDAEPFVMYSPNESRYFHDVLVALFEKANITPRFVQYLSQIHSILALVRSGLGLALVPSAASNLRFEGVLLRHLQSADRDPIELFLAWRQDHDNPLLPSLVEIARSVRVSARTGD